MHGFCCTTGGCFVWSGDSGGRTPAIQPPKAQALAGNPPKAPAPASPSGDATPATYYDRQQGVREPDQDLRDQ